MMVIEAESSEKFAQQRAKAGSVGLARIDSVEINGQNSVFLPDTNVTTQSGLHQTNHPPPPMRAGVGGRIQLPPRPHN